MEAVAKLLEAVGHLVWPAVLVGLLIVFRRELRGLFNRGGEVGLEILGNKLTIKPTAAERKPGTGAVLLDPVPEGQPLPADYFFLNHTAFLRPERGPQVELIPRPCSTARTSKET